MNQQGVVIQHCGKPRVPPIPLLKGWHDFTFIPHIPYPQTSGGLVFGVQPAEVETALKKLLETGHDAAVIGSMDTGSGLIRLLNPQK